MIWVGSIRLSKTSGGKNSAACSAILAIKKDVNPQQIPLKPMLTYTRLTFVDAAFKFVLKYTEKRIWQVRRLYSGTQRSKCIAYCYSQAIFIVCINIMQISRSSHTITPHYLKPNFLCDTIWIQHHEGLGGKKTINLMHGFLSRAESF